VGVFLITLLELEGSQHVVQCVCKYTQYRECALAKSTVTFTNQLQTIFCKTFTRGNVGCLQHKPFVLSCISPVYSRVGLYSPQNYCTAVISQTYLFRCSHWFSNEIHQGRRYAPSSFSQDLRRTYTALPLPVQRSVDVFPSLKLHFDAPSERS